MNFERAIDYDLVNTDSKIIPRGLGWKNYLTLIEINITDGYH